MGINEAGARPTPHRAVSEWPSPGLVNERVRSGVSLRRGGAVALRVRLALQLRTRRCGRGRRRLQVRATQLRDQAHAVVDQQSGGRAQRDAAEGHVADNPREVCDRDDQGDRGGVQVHRVGEVDAVLHPDANAQHADHAVQDRARAAEDAGGNRRDEGTELRQHRQDQGDAGRDDVRRRRVHAGRSHHADVLGVGGRTRAAAAAGQHRGEAVRDERAARQVVHVLARHRGHRLHVADVLGDQDEDDRQEQAQRRRGETRSMELGQADPRGLLHRLEGHLALNDRRHVADQHADQNGEAAENSLKEHRHQADRHDRHDRRGRTLLHPVPCGGCQVQADERHNRASHHRRHRHINPAHAREMDDQADERERRTRRNDAAERVGRAHRRRHRSDRRNQRKRRTQVRGQATRRNQEEQQGADRSEKKRC